MNIQLVDQVIGDVKAAFDDTQHIVADVRQSAHLRWRLLCAETTLFKLGLQRLTLLVPVMLILVLLAAMALSSLIGYSIYLVTGSPFVALLLVLVLQSTLLAFAGMRALATVRAMDFARSRAHLLKLSRHVVE